MQEPATRNSRGPGRPATASLIWEDPTMQMNLVRLYLYTAEGSLSTMQISNLITELAREKLKRFEISLFCFRDNFVRVSANLPCSSRRSLKSKPESRIRSTQNQLRTLLSDDYHRLRTRNREIARARIDDLRLIRDGRIKKRRNRRKVVCRQNSRPVNGGSKLEIPKSRFDIDTASKRSSINSFDTWVSTESTEAEPSQYGKPKQRVRVSWIRDVLGRSNEKRPSSSVIMDIRSLLSTHSLRSSLFSRNSSSINLTPTPSLPFTDTGRFDQRNRVIIELCCQWRPDCLHRRVAQLISGSNQAAEMTSQLAAGPIKDDRDIWNSTILHLLAQWGKDMSVVSLLSLIVHNCQPSMVSARNIDGDTFFHILARRWSETTEIPDTAGLKDLITLLGIRGFRFDICNSTGCNVLASFIPEAFIGRSRVLYPKPTARHRSVVHTLRSLFSIEDGGHFLLESFATISPNNLRDPLSAFLWSEALYNESLDEEIRILAETRERAQIWRERATIATYRPVPSLHTFLQHQTIISIDLLDQGADPNEYNEDGKTCLMVLLEKSAELQLPESTTIRLVQMLLDRGASAKLLDLAGNTALHYAVKVKLPDVVPQLIKAGADLDARDIRGKTCADLAINDYELARHFREGTPYAVAQTMLVRLFDVSSRRMRRNRRSLPGITE